MSTHLRAGIALVVDLLQRLALGLIIAAAIVGPVSVGLAFAGVWPWLSLDIAWGTRPLPDAGIWVQSGLAALAVMLAVFLPANARILALETSHRRFHVAMEDVARAYHLAHAADRQGVFHLGSEFDSVRERLSYLRSHPDLDALEPALLDIAAQMSHVSRELAEVYSDARVARARDFLRQRQEEVERFNARIDTAKAVASELRHWMAQVELEESVAASQLERLRAELDAILPELGLETVAAPGGSADLVALPRAAE